MKIRLKEALPWFILGSILLFALALRIWGINYDLPYIYHPDEPTYIRIALNIVKTGDLNPHFFNYPSLFLYINSFTYFLAEVIGKLTGMITSFDEIRAPISITMGVSKAQTPAIVWMSRFVTVFFSIGSIILVFQTGKKITQHWSVGAIAALLMAISPINTANAHYITPDTFVQFFAIFALFAAIDVYQQGRTWQYILTGICVGLTASCKYNGALVFAPLLLAHILRRGKQAIVDKNIYLALIFAAIGFLLFTPFAIFDFPNFISDLKYEAVHYSTGHIGMEGNTLSYYLQLMWQNNGLAYTFSGLEVIRGIYTRNKVILLVAIFPLIYFPIISSFVVRNDRTFLPAIPFVFLLASSFLYTVFQKIRQLKFQEMRRFLLVTICLLAVITLAFPAYKTISGSANKFNSEDAREISRKWIIANVPKGSKIAIEAYSPYLEMDNFDVQTVPQIIFNSPDWYIKNNFHYLVFSDWMYGRFFREPDLYSSQIFQYNQFFDRFKQIGDFKGGTAEIRVYQIP